LFVSNNVKRYQLKFLPEHSLFYFLGDGGGGGGFLCPGKLLVAGSGRDGGVGLGGGVGFEFSLFII